MAPRQDDPTLQDFYHDMNEHGNAEYHRVPPHHVVEVEKHRRRKRNDRSRLVVWKAVVGFGDYEEPDVDDNRYEWEAVGGKWFDTLDGATEAAKDLDNKGAVLKWCDENPYEDQFEQPPQNVEQ